MGEIRYMISEAARQVQVEAHVLRYWEEELGLEIGRTEMGHRYYTKDDIQLFLCIQKLKNEGMLLRDLKPLIPELTETRKKRNAAKMQQEASKTVDMPSDRTAPGSVSAQTKQALSSKDTSQTKHAPTSDNTSQTKHSPASDNTLQTKHSPNSDSTLQIKHTLSSDSTLQTKHTLSSDSIGKSKKEASFSDTSTEKEHAAAPAASVPALAETEVIPVTQLEQVRSLIGDVLTEVVTTNNDVLKKDISKKVTADVIREMDFLFQANERREEEHYRKLDCLIRQQQASRREAARNTPIGKLKKLLT